MLKVAVAGCAGRMGQALVKEIKASSDLTLAAGTVSSLSTKIDIGAPVVENLQDVINSFDVLIDFTNPKATLAHLALCVQHNKKMVIGTTGLNSDQFAKVKEAAKDLPIVFAPNMSVGLNVCLHLIKEATKLLGDADIHISEAHHRHKKDSPSGTALNMAQRVHEVLPEKPLEHSSIRAGDIVGEHSILFALPGETIQLTHNASNRDIFAMGALRAARWLQTKPVGLYNMSDVLGLPA